MYICLGALQVVVVVKNLPANAGDARDVGSIPGLGRSPGVENGNPFQYSCLESSMDRGALWVTVHGVTKSQNMTEQLNTHTHKHTHTHRHKCILLILFLWRTLIHIYVKSISIRLLFLKLVSKHPPYRVSMEKKWCSESKTLSTVLGTQ